jgi:hypothetical protein
MAGLFNSNSVTVKYFLFWIQSFSTKTDSSKFSLQKIRNIQYMPNACVHVFKTCSKIIKLFCMRACIHTHTHIHVYVFVHLCVRTIYIYIYIYIYICYILVYISLPFLGCMSEGVYVMHICIYTCKHGCMPNASMSVKKHVLTACTYACMRVYADA